MNGNEILRIVDAIHHDKAIDADDVFEGIEQAILSAARKHFSEEEQLEVRIDRETGEPSLICDGRALEPELLGDAGLGLPGLAGFWGELLAIAGAWRSDSAMGAISRPVAVLAAVGTAVAAAYLLRVLRRLWHGPGGAPAAPASLGGPSRFIGDATRHEVVVMMPLVAATVALGVLPAILLEVTGPAVRALLAGAP